MEKTISESSDHALQLAISKAGALLETLPYLRRFRGSTFVIKYGGSFMDSPDPALRQGVARDIVFLQAVGINTVVVHGGGKAITAAMESAGLKAKFVRGMRVTDEAAVEIVERVLSREINPQIDNTIDTLGASPRGFSGTEIFKCAKLRQDSPSGEPIDLGFVGEVCAVDGGRLTDCIREGFIPVISPTARGGEGKIYNCNADVAAAQTAIALKASRLIFMSDVPGLMRDPKNPGTIIRRLRAGEIDELIKSGVVDKGMIPKVESAAAALRAGVARVSLVDGRLPHGILLDMFEGCAAGTEVVLNEPEPRD
jgi:acetylglutamate kinase